MKKLLSIGLAFLLTLCLGISLTGCSNQYYDPRGIKWYNEASLPNITSPFNETYDGSYSIQIDKKGNVTFTPFDGEALKGKTSVSRDKQNPSHSADISIQFENGKTAEGDCYKNDDGRFLSIYYEYKKYVFSGKRQQTKEEFEIYRGQFIDFLTGVYETGVFPTKDEIKKNGLYKRFTDYRQIDPCCNGPIVYDSVEKVKLEKIEILTEDNAEITVNVNGESFVCQVGTQFVTARIKDGKIEPIALSEVKTGDCLVIPHSYTNNGQRVYRISGIFCIENG